MPANTALHTLWLASADAAAAHIVWGIICVPRGTEAAVSTREPTPFATFLLRYRAAAHLTQEQLVARAGVRWGEDGSGFPDGDGRVVLTPFRDPGLALGAIGRALGRLNVGGRPAGEPLGEAPGGRRQLVVLDKVEQVLPAAPQLVDLL